MNDAPFLRSVDHAAAYRFELGDRVIDDMSEQRRYMRTPQRMASVLHWWIVRARITDTCGLAE